MPTSTSERRKQLEADLVSMGTQIDLLWEIAASTHTLLKAISKTKNKLSADQLVSARNAGNAMNAWHKWQKETFG